MYSFWFYFAQNTVKIDFFSEKNTIFYDWDISFGSAIFEVSGVCTFLQGFVFPYQNIDITVLLRTNYDDGRENCVTECSASFSEYLFLKMHLDFILFKLILSARGRPSAGGSFMSKKNIHFSATREWKQVYVILERKGVCTVTFFSHTRSFLANNFQFDAVWF